MKNIIYLLTVLSLISCLKEGNKYSEISFKLDNVKFIEIQNPLEDVYMWDIKKDTIYPNANNEFSFKKEVSSPQRINIKIGDELIYSILQPNNKIRISYKDSSFVFDGKNKAGLNLLNKFERSYYSFSESNKYLNDSTSHQISEKINSQKEKELNELNSLIANNEIDKELAEALKDEIDYFYANRTLDVIIEKLNIKKQKKEDLINLFNLTQEKYPLNNDYKSSSWLKYGENILIQKPISYLKSNNIISQDTLQKWWKNDKLHEFKYNIINRFENKSITEKISANYLIHSLKQKHFEKSLISVYEKFNKEYPNSKYTKYLKPEVQIIEEYFEKISKEMPSGVKFIENKNISSFDELLKTIEGDKYYVDLWATWCGPCKDQFKHNKKLNALLKSKGYKKLYISIDKPENIKKWKQDIKYYELEGLHLLANQDFFIHFEENYSPHNGYVSIPQYLIVDNKGNVLTKNAPRPSELSKLSNLLK